MSIYTNPEGMLKLAMERACRSNDKYDADVFLNSEQDNLISIIIPFILAFIVFPFVTIRSAIMGWNFYARRKFKFDLEDGQQNTVTHRNKTNLLDQSMMITAFSLEHSSTCESMKDIQTLDTTRRNSPAELERRNSF